MLVCLCASMCIFYLGGSFTAAFDWVEGRKKGREEGRREEDVARKGNSYVD